MICQECYILKTKQKTPPTVVLSDKFKLRHPEVEWYKIAGLRNILVHDYLGIVLETVWVTVSRKLQELKKVVRTVLG
jgi:uncharacterized protein with HEPN domain